MVDNIFKTISWPSRPAFFRMWQKVFLWMLLGKKSCFLPTLRQNELNLKSITMLNPDSHLFTSSNDEDIRSFAMEMMEYLYSFSHSSSTI